MKFSHLITDQELYHLSVIPKAHLTVRTHFACKNLASIVDRILAART